MIFFISRGKQQQYSFTDLSFSLSIWCYIPSRLHDSFLIHITYVDVLQKTLLILRILSNHISSVASIKNFCIIGSKINLSVWTRSSSEPMYLISLPCAAWNFPLVALPLFTVANNTSIVHVVDQIRNREISLDSLSHCPMSDIFKNKLMT